MRVPSAFVVLLQAGSRVTRAAGEARGGGNLAWKKSSEVSFRRDTRERERVSASLCSLPWTRPRSWPLGGSAGNWDHS